MTTETKTAATPRPWEVVPERLLNGHHVAGRGIKLVSDGVEIGRIFRHNVTELCTWQSSTHKTALMYGRES